MPMRSCGGVDGLFCQQCRPSRRRTLQRSRAAEARRSESGRSMMRGVSGSSLPGAPDLSQACGVEPPAPESIECSGKIVEAKSDVSTSESVLRGPTRVRLFIRRLRWTLCDEETLCGEATTILDARTLV